MSIRRALARFTAVALLMSITSYGFSEAPAFDRLLIPVSVSLVPGAYGSVWSTELWYRNNGEKPVAIEPLAVSDRVPTVGITEQLRIFTSPAQAPGQVLYVSRGGIDDAQFDLRLFNRSAEQNGWGTKLPVVRETELQPAVTLINVPTSGSYRGALRIYSLSEGAPVVDVRISTSTGALLAQSALLLEGEPRYAQILSLSDAFPAIRHTDRVTIQVRSRDAAEKIWAFVSITSNTTQAVAIVAPD